MIGQAERFGGLRDVPGVRLEGGDDDLAFGLCLQRLQRARAPRIGARE